MKYRFILLLLFVCCWTQAQGQQLDSMSFILSEFGRGTVVYADKHFGQGMLNISPMDQLVYCISANDTLVVDGNDRIVNVIISGRSFVKWKDTYVETVYTNNEGVGVAISRCVSRVSNVKTGAYGTTSSTSSQRSYSYGNSIGVLRPYIVDDPRNFIYKQNCCLVKDGNIYPVSKKSFEKLFPGKKELVDSLWQSKNIDVTDSGSIIDFIEACQQ